jgi:hypothetical protein
VSELFKDETPEDIAYKRGVSAGVDRVAFYLLQQAGEEFMASGAWAERLRDLSEQVKREVLP